MSRSHEIIAQIVARKPFAVLGYSADDAVWCPACLRTAAGLSPGRPDTSGKPIAPLFARDATVREEICEHCEHPLRDLLASEYRAPERKAIAAELRVYGKRAALEFDRVPPVEVRTALKSTGWRWDPQLRVWWSGDEVPAIPAGVILPARNSAPAAPKAPFVRRRRVSVRVERLAPREPVTG